MKKQDAIKIFEDKKVRALWDAEQEKWYISIVDAVAALTDSPNPQVYWRVMKKRLKDEGNETVTNCNGLKKRGLEEGQQFATLTDIITKAWAGKTTKEYKILKGLKKENLRDNMTNTELILNMLAEASVKDISAAVNPETFEDSKKVAKQGGNVAKVARIELEARTGKKVVTALNAKAILNESNSTKKLNDKKSEK